MPSLKKKPATPSLSVEDIYKLHDMVDVTPYYFKNILGTEAQAKIGKAYYDLTYKHNAIAYLNYWISYRGCWNIKYKSKAGGQKLEDKSHTDLLEYYVVNILVEQKFKNSTVLVLLTDLMIDFYRFMYFNTCVFFTYKGKEFNKKDFLANCKKLRKLENETEYRLIMVTYDESKAKLSITEKVANASIVLVDNYIKPFDIMITQITSLLNIY